MFEEDIHRYPSNDYVWTVNSNGNLIGKSIATGQTVFTWQPHGSQFTIHEAIPHNAVRFTLKKPPVTSVEAILTAMDFKSDWVKIIRN